MHRDRNKTPFQQSSISGRLETLRKNGNISEKRIEELAFWMADKQRIKETIARNRCNSVLKEHQSNLKRLWKQNLENIPKKESPGPGHYGDISQHDGMSMQKNNASSYSFGKSTRLVEVKGAKKSKRDKSGEDQNTTMNTD